MGTNTRTRSTLSIRLPPCSRWASISPKAFCSTVTPTTKTTVIHSAEMKPGRSVVSMAR